VQTPEVHAPAPKAAVMKRMKSENGPDRCFFYSHVLLKNSRSPCRVVLGTRSCSRSGFARRSCHLLDLRMESVIPDWLILIHGQTDFAYRILVSSTRNDVQPSLPVPHFARYSAGSSADSFQPGSRRTCSNRPSACPCARRCGRCTAHSGGQ
jgi:hypothetical protein